MVRSCRELRHTLAGLNVPGRFWFQGRRKIDDLAMKLKFNPERAVEIAAACAIMEADG
jgi:hypothetical protein